MCVDSNDNELAYLEAIHLFVEVLGESGSRKWSAVLEVASEAREGWELG